MLVLAVVGLMVVVVSAGGGRSRDRDGSGDYSCVCSTQCVGNTGTKNIGCRKSRVQFLQCAGITCSSQVCPTNQLFNAVTALCQPCPTGQHVDALNKRCVCNQGTTWVAKTQSCSQCATGTIQTADRCDCVSPAIINKGANACQICPSGTIRSGKGCTCTDTTKFFDAVSFTCLPCPGTWTTVTRTDRRGSYTKQVCQCPTLTDVFNPRTVKCVTCPNGSIVSTNKEGCKLCTCTAITQIYDVDNNVCVDRATYIGNSNSNSNSMGY